MNANYRLKTLVTILILMLVTAGCGGAARQSYKKGTTAEISKDYDVALEQYRQALAAEPDNIDYR